MKNATPVKEPVNKETCHHYWLIETPKGLTSGGVCKYCGARKEFYNSWSFLVMAKQTGQFGGRRIAEPVQEEEREPSPEEV